ncbi:hypothetical protein Tco_0406267 [Tanacetum coccineum]
MMSGWFDCGDGYIMMMMMTVVVSVWGGSGVVLVINDGDGGDSGWRWWFRWQRWRVAESEYGDRVDPLMRITFDLGRKSPPEKFSGGGGGRRLAGSGGWRNGGERGSGVCV